MAAHRKRHRAVRLETLAAVMRAALGWVVLVLLAACERGPLPDFDALWNYDDPAATEERFREILDSGPADRDYRIQLTTQLARAIGLQGRFDEGIALLDAVEDELSQSTPATHARWLLERGRIYLSSGSPLLARRPFEDALALTTPREGEPPVDPTLDRFAVDAAHMLAIEAEGKDAIAWNRRAMAIAEASSDQKARDWLGSLYNNLGFAEIDLGHYDAALKTHQTAVAWFVEKGDAQRARLSRWAVGKTLRLLDRCPDALTIQVELEAEWAAAGAPDGYVFEEIAECRLVLGEAEVARRYFAQALEALGSDAWLLEHEPDRLERMEALAHPQTDDAPTKPGETS